MTKKRPGKRQNKLQRRLLNVVILAALIPSLVLFLFNYFIVYTNMGILLEKDQKQEVILGANQVAFFVNEVRSILHSAGATAIKDQMDSFPPEFDTRRIQVLVSRFSFIRMITLYGPDGKIQASVTPVGKLEKPVGIDLDSEALTTLHRQNWLLGVSCQKEPQVNQGLLTVPVIIKNHPVGYVQALFDVSHIYGAMGTLEGQEGYTVYVINKEGKVLGRLASHVQQKQLKQLIMDPGKNHSIFRYVNTSGRKVTSTGAPIMGTSWILVMERPEAAHFSGPFVFFKAWLGLFLVFLVLCSLGAYLLIHKQLKTFEKLHEGVEAFSSGNFRFRFDIQTGDEIQELAESFNRMAAYLQEQRRQTNFAMKELKKKKRELEVSNKHMREASRLRSEFLANMSHELRTPLNTVIGYSSIMLDGIYGEVGKKQKETLEKIYHQAFELSKLINDILDLSKMDAGKMPIFKERFRMSQVIKEILLQYRPKIQVKKLKLNLAVNSDLEIESDRSKIKQVMSHIISNAVKFTREGSITISCEKTPAKDHLKISVMDTGIGIDKKSIGKIFDEFRQLDGSHTREYGGTGMGLSISKRILKMLNAKITVKSKKDQGSNFTIYLPLESADEGSGSLPGRSAGTIIDGKEDLEPREVDLNLNLNRKLLLSVDGDMEFLGIMKDILGPTGFQVITTSSASEGFELARKYRPYMVTTDMVLPENSARDFIRKVKSDPVTFDIPLLVISTLDERSGAYSLGASDYFIKPLDRERFLYRLEAFQQMRGRRIMLVNDDREYLDQFFVILREHGFQVTTSTEGKEAMERLRREKPDLAIINHTMSVDGRKTLLEQLWEEELHQEIPLMVVNRDKFTKVDRESMAGRVFTLMERLVLQREEVVPNLLSIFERLWCHRETHAVKLAGENKDRPDKDEKEES